jgi:hypothetical protein
MGLAIHLYKNTENYNRSKTLTGKILLIFRFKPIFLNESRKKS